MVKFIHSSDWQLGARYSQFGAKADFLRACRLKALECALAHAEAAAADAFVIAGDLFEDNQVGPATVAGALEVFNRFTRVPILIVPGNHDPYTGPGCIWNRPALATPAPHVRIVREPAAFECGGAWFVVNPLTQKNSTTDPSLKLAELARTVPSGAIKIGITHGSPAIESKHKPDDFPIALDAPQRAGLDFLAVGHWHSWLQISERFLVPGSPEPGSFSEEGAGFVAEVTLAGAGSIPEIRQVRVATLSWHNLPLDVSQPEAARRAVAERLEAIGPDRAATLLRVRLTGAATPEARTELADWISTQFAGCADFGMIDQTTSALRPEELAQIKHRHPVLGAVLGDLEAAAPSGEFLELCRQLECADPAEQAALAETVRRVLTDTITEVSRAD